MHTNNCSIFAIYKLYNRIMNLLPYYVTNRFFGLQERNNGTRWVSERARINKKIDWLIERNNKYKKSNIRPISYSCSLNKDPHELKVTLKNDTDGSCKINIGPDKFRYQSSLHEIYKDWLVNLSDENIPQEVGVLLQLGEGSDCHF